MVYRSPMGRIDQLFVTLRDLQIPVIMATRDQIKKEFFLSLRKGPYEPVVNDVVIEGIVCKDLYKKCRYELTHEAFIAMADELEEAGYFTWNNDGHLALTEKGLAYLSEIA